MGQNTPEDGPSAAWSVCTVSLAGIDFEGRLCSSKLICPSMTTPPRSPLAAVSTFRSSDFTEYELVFLLEVMLHLLLVTVAGSVAAGDLCRFFFFSRGLYSQMSFSESSFCDIWSKTQRNWPNVTQRSPQNTRYYTGINV